MERPISTGVKRSLVNDIALAKHFDDLDANGFCVVEDVLSADEVSGIREKLLAAAAESDQRGVPTHIPSLDPNDANVRVFNLLRRKCHRKRGTRDRLWLLLCCVSSSAGKLECVVSGNDPTKFIPANSKVAWAKWYGEHAQRRLCRRAQLVGG